MRRWRPLLVFFSLLVLISLSCNVPGNDLLNSGKVAQVTSISVTPPSGRGNFSVVVKGTTLNDVESSELVCYVAPDKADTKDRYDISGNISNGWSFTRNFTFTYANPGIHSLVCLINDGSGTAWSEDFEVVPPPTLTITAFSGTMTYGGTVPTITASYLGFVNGDTASSLKYAPTCWTLATRASPSGGFYPTLCSGADADGNYTIIYEDGVIGVSPAPLTITAFSTTMTEGGTVPTITPSYSGFVNGDTASSMQTAPICSTTATSTSPAGTYPSSCSGAVYAVYPKYENYTIIYIAGSVTVIPATPTTLVLNGKFKFPESEYTCPNGKLIHNSVWAATGTLVLTVDYTKLQASVTLQGSGQGTSDMCNYSLVATESYTIDGVTLSGRFDPSTNALTITGDLTFPLHSSCQIIDETVNPPACIAGDQTIKSNITLNGSIDPVNSTGQGQIQWTGSEDWGVWQAP